MDDRSCLELSDIRHLLSQVIAIYVQAMNHARGLEAKLAAAQLAEGTLHRYLRLLTATDLEVELRQMQRIIGDMRQPRFEE
jgi:hypothetical protein